MRILKSFLTNLQILKTHNLQYIDRRLIDSDVWLYSFKKPATLNFEAGQHLLFTVPHKKSDKRGDRRFFAIASAPSDENLEIATRYFGFSASTFKRALYNLEKDSITKVRGPLGTFGINKESLNHVFIAGGIGITSVRSIVRELINTKESTNKIKIYHVSADNEYTFKKEFKEYSKNNSKIEYVTLKREELNSEVLKNDLLENTSFYITGTSNFNSNVFKLLKNIGVNNSQIIIENFKGIFGGGY